MCFVVLETHEQTKMSTRKTHEHKSEIRSLSYCSANLTKLSLKSMASDAVRDELRNIDLTVDSTAEAEPEGLIASHPRLRPPDVLTGAFHNGHLAAVDVGVISPSAAGAGSNCVVTMHDRKTEGMQPFADQLEATGITYAPFAVSCCAPNVEQCGETHG